MKLHRLTTLLWLAMAASSCLAESRYNLNLQNDPTLKTVYDAGMRPWRVTDNNCMVGGQGEYSLHQVTLTFPGSKAFTFPAEWTSFSIFSDYQLSGMNVKSLAMPIPHAVLLAKIICEAMKFSTDGLDAFAASIDDKTRWSNKWGVNVERDHIQFQLLLSPVPQFEKDTLFTVSLSADWEVGTSAERAKRILSTPMQPPEGYRDCSMAIPTPPPGQKPVPEHDMQYYKDLSDKAKKAPPAPATTP